MYVTLTDEQYAEWDGTPEDLAAILDRPDLAHASLGDDYAHVPGGRTVWTQGEPDQCAKCGEVYTDGDADEDFCSVCRR